jgi:hypothetical protein
MTEDDNLCENMKIAIHGAAYFTWNGQFNMNTIHTHATGYQLPIGVSITPGRFVAGKFVRLKFILSIQRYSTSLG